MLAGKAFGIVMSKIVMSKNVKKTGVKMAMCIKYQPLTQFREVHLMRNIVHCTSAIVHHHTLPFHFTLENRENGPARAIKKV